MEQDMQGQPYVYLVVADESSQWGDVCEQIENGDAQAGVRLVCCALADLLEGRIDPTMCDIIVAKFNHGAEILTVQCNYPRARLVLGVAGDVTKQVLELLTVAPVVIVRIPPRLHEVQELVHCPMVTSVQSLLKMSMRASFTSREVGSLKMVFPLGEWLVKAGIVKEKEWRGLHVAFQEALTNSLEHGNLELQSEWKDDFDSAGKDRYTIERKSRLNQDEYGGRSLKIETVYDGTNLVVSIEDEGKGFDVKSLVDRPPSVDACHGRGFSLISAYVDTVLFNSKGTKITMKKRIGEV
jgi:anti-sigma regulatory factor (Ser/Thr protein kinase)